VNCVCLEQDWVSFGAGMTLCALFSLLLTLLRFLSVNVPLDAVLNPKMDVDVPKNVTVDGTELREGGSNEVDVSAAGSSAVVLESAEIASPEPFVKRGRGRPKKNASAASTASGSPSKAKASASASAPRAKASGGVMKVGGGGHAFRAGILSEAEMSALPYTAKKAYLESIRQKRWEIPVAPARFARPLTVATGQFTYSIGQHFLTGQENFEALSEELAKAATVNPFPHWTCPLSSVTLIGDEHWNTFVTGDQQATKVDFTEVPQPQKQAKKSASQSSSCSSSSSASNDAPSEPISIQRHSSHRHNTPGTDFFLNAGGPVNDLAWCPLPWGTYESKLPSPQFMHSFLAVSTIKNNAIQDVVGEYGGRENAIQLWDLGSLTNAGEKTGASFSPFLSVAFVHQCGRVQHMTWCPLPSAQPRHETDLFPTRRKTEHPHTTIQKRHQQQQEQREMRMDTASDAIGILTEEEAGEEAFPRLGLLAVAFAHGVVAIFTIPHPHALHLHYNGNAYSKKPLLIDLKSRMTLIAPGRSQVCRLAWTHHGRAERLAAGTIDGKVAVWELPENTHDELHPQMKLSPVELTKGDAQVIVDSSSSSSSSRAPNAASSSKRPSGNGMDMDIPTGAKEKTAKRLPTRDEVLLGLVEPVRPSLKLYEVNSTYMPIFYRQTSVFMVSGLAWHPKEPNLLGITSMSIYSWVWDIRHANTPASQTMTLGAMGSDMVFAGPEVDYSYLMAMDDGTCRLVTPPTSRSHDIHIAPSHTIDYSPLLRLRVSAGLDGLVHIASLVDSRNTKALFLFTAKDPLGMWIDRISKYEPHQTDKPSSASTTTTTTTTGPTTDAEGSSSDLPRPDRPKVEGVVYFSHSSVDCANSFSPPLVDESTITRGRPKRGQEIPKKDPNAKKTGIRRTKVVPSSEVETLKRPQYPHEDVFINRIRWNPNPRTPSWLAYGTRSGILRVQLLPWASPPDL